MTTPEEIKTKLQTDPSFVGAALITLRNLQTSTELYHGTAEEANGRGFNKLDAGFLTSLADFFEAKHYLSPKQLAVARAKLLKYSRQLSETLSPAHLTPIEASRLHAEEIERAYRAMGQADRESYINTLFFMREEGKIRIEEAQLLARAIRDEGLSDD